MILKNGIQGYPQSLRMMYRFYFPGILKNGIKDYPQYIGMMYRITFPGILKNGKRITRNT